GGRGEALAGRQRGAEVGPPFDHALSVTSPHLVEKADLVEGTEPHFGLRGSLLWHLERARELDLADADAGRRDLPPCCGRVLELDRLMAGVEAEAEMTVDDRRIDSPPAHGRAEAIVEESDRLLARLDDAVGLGLETDPNLAAMPLGEPVEIDRQVGEDGRTFLRARRLGRRRIGQR